MTVPFSIALAAAIFWVQPSPAKSLELHGFPPANGFEQDAPTSYTWTHAAVLARLDPGGIVSIILPNQAQVRLIFPGATGASEPHGEGRLEGTSFYYLGAASSWRSTAHFDQVRYPEIYPGIDLVFITKAGQLEYNFEIAPGADANRIKIRYQNANVTLRVDGTLAIQAAHMQFEQGPPHAFQQEGNKRRDIRCDYRLHKNGLTTLHPAGYQGNAALVIDPQLNFSTLVGGASFDAVYALATDASGNLYITGESSSGSLTGGSASNRASRDAFVAKLNASGALVYAVFAGGSGNDSGQGIAVDAQGNAYVTGVTASADFPTTTGVLGKQTSGAEDAFVLKLNSNGLLQYSTYLGGPGSDSGLAIALDGSKAVYVAGRTESPAFPVTAGAFQTTYRGGSSDCFVSKLNTTGSALVYSTFFGGSGLDECTGIAVDTAGNAYVTGTTYSINYPTQTPLQSVLGGTDTAFVAEINPLGSGLVYSTFLGGSNIDNGNGIAVDSTGAAYVAGTTASPDFPITPPAYQTMLKGLYNAFVSKISPHGTGLVYSTLIGGSSTDTATAIAVDGAGRAVVGGYTTSTNFPMVKAIQPIYQGSFEAFATVLNAQGTSLIFSSYFGGSGDDRAYAVGAIPAAQLYLAGMTSSTKFPTVSAFDSQSAPYDAFALQVTYVGRMLVWQDDATAQVAEWTLGGPRGSTYESWSWLNRGSEIGWTLVSMADMNGDGYLDLIWQNNSSRQIAVWYMGGPQGNVYQSWGWLSAGIMTGWTLVGAVDLNADGHPDLIWQNDSSRQVAVWYMGGPLGTVYQSWAWLSAGVMTGWTLVGTADFNGDGHPDLIWQLDSSRQVAVWYMSGPLGNLYQSWNWLNSGVMTGSTVAGVCDLDGDGHPDLIWQNRASRAVTAWYMGSPQGDVLQSTAVLSTGLPAWTIRGCF